MDIPTCFAELLRAFVRDTQGFLFTTESGQPLSQRNALRSLHAAGLNAGFHVFRRFRMETLRINECPRDLQRFWMGHTNEEVRGLYAEGIRHNMELREKWAEQIGTGFRVHIVHRKVVVAATNVA